MRQLPVSGHARDSCRDPAPRRAPGGAEAGQLEVPRLERRLGLVAAIGFITPMVGLLGTVTGLIEAFVTISSQSGFASSTDIASGIYQSLLTTAAGLVVAIPCAVAYCYLSSRVNTLLHDMERAGIEIVNLLIECRPPASPDIIEFGPARSADPGDLRRQKSE
jgi:biopolymer transport protein ExbB